MVKKVNDITWSIGQKKQQLTLYTTFVVRILHRTTKKKYRRYRYNFVFLSFLMGVGGGGDNIFSELILVHFQNLKNDSKMNVILPQYSSEPSRQSSMKLQTRLIWIQSPSSHWNCSVMHPFDPTLNKLFFSTQTISVKSKH